jgi:hypothetical protein
VVGGGGLKPNSYNDLKVIVLYLKYPGAYVMKLFEAVNL